MDTRGLITSIHCLGISSLVFPLFNRAIPPTLSRIEFSQWLSGFIDAEGNFQVFFDRYPFVTPPLALPVGGYYLRVMFRIRLHVDDIAILYAIQTFLGVGTVRIEGTSCLFVINKVQDLLTVLIPLLDEFKLLTVKYLDNLDFKTAVMYLSSLPTTRPNPTDLPWIKGLIIGMNLGRNIFDLSLIPTVVITRFWLLGFIEGEGTFGIKGLSPYFQLPQPARSLYLLEAIKVFLSHIPNGFLFSLHTLAPTMAVSLNVSTNVYTFSLQDIDSLYDYPFVTHWQSQWVTNYSSYWVCLFKLVKV